jgi:hypothetical protein
MDSTIQTPMSDPLQYTSKILRPKYLRTCGKHRAKVPYMHHVARRVWGEGDSSGDPPITHLKELEEALSSATDRKSNRHSVTEKDRIRCFSPSCKACLFGSLVLQVIYFYTYIIILIYFFHCVNRQVFSLIVSVSVW